MPNTINIFPLSNAGAGTGHKLTEGNIASLITAMSSPEHKNFVVAATINADNQCQDIKFVMQGRFFDISFDPAIETNYYATIYISNNTPAGEPKDAANDVLTSITNSEEASGSVEPQADGESASDSETTSSTECFIQFSTESPAIASNHYSLQLLELDNGTLRIPISSQFQLKGNRIANISGGTV